MPLNIQEKSRRSNILYKIPNISLSSEFDDPQVPSITDLRTWSFEFEINNHLVHYFSIRSGYGSGG